MNVDLLAFEGMDLMDFSGPLEVFLTANRLLERRGADSAFTVTAVTIDGGPVTTYGGLRITPHRSAADLIDRGRAVLLVPGTIDIDAAVSDAVLVATIAQLAARADLLASVCTGAFLLQSAGLLRDTQWTTHWEDIEALALLTPGGRRARVMDAGSVVTAGGIASGIDLGLHLVARLTDPELARLTARQMDYAWDHYGDPRGGVDPVVIERDVRLSPGEVYRLWTTESGVAEFLDTKAVIDGHVGGQYEFQFLPDEPDGLRGGEGCRILAMEPGRLLVFTWNSPPGFPTRGTHTWVVLSLIPTPTGTHLRLAHWGHGQGGEWDANREYFRNAWGRVLDRLTG